jgi:hypothetical protein
VPELSAMAELLRLHAPWPSEQPRAEDHIVLGRPLSLDGGPLWAASTFGYTPAVDALVRCGARADNLVLAAAAGDLAAVHAHFDEAGRVKPTPDWDRLPMPGRRLDERHTLEYALIQAALHGRRSVVEILLSKTPDLSVHEPNWNNTALTAARWAKHADIVALLESASPT